MYISIYITCGSVGEAEKIAETLVVEKLAACVNYFPVNSVYVWKGKVGIEQMSLDGVVIGEETVIIPACTFDTYKVKIDIKDSNGKTVSSSNRWFADGVGMIKEETVTGSMQVTAELKEYNIKSK